MRLEHQEDTLLEHSQWKVQSREHVCLLVKGLLFPTVEAKRKDVARALKHKWCCGIAEDEWVIGTFLRKYVVLVGNSESKCEDGHINNDNSSTIPYVATHCDDIDWLDGVCTMEQTMVSEFFARGGKSTGHAKLLSNSERSILFKQAEEDCYTFALRKVGSYKLRE
jgi:hypothetical protein